MTSNTLHAQQDNSFWERRRKKKVRKHYLCLFWEARSSAALPTLCEQQRGGRALPSRLRWSLAWWTQQARGCGRLCSNGTSSGGFVLMDLDCCVKAHGKSSTEKSSLVLLLSLPSHRCWEHWHSSCPDLHCRDQQLPPDYE